MVTIISVAFSLTLLKVVANRIFILYFGPSYEVLGSMPDGVGKFKVLMKVVFCFELIRDMTMGLLLVKSEQRVLCVSELSFYHNWWMHSFWSQEVEVGP